MYNIAGGVITVGLDGVRVHKKLSFTAALPLYFAHCSFSLVDIDVPSAVEVFTTLRYINVHLLTYFGRLDNSCFNWACNVSALGLVPECVLCVFRRYCYASVPYSVDGGTVSCLFACACIPNIVNVMA